MWEHQYSRLDRVLHRLAFSTWPIQAALADAEQVAFKRLLDPVTIDRPVFVTGLPRAGTTLVLELIEGVGEFASYRYRDMPFLLCPLLWNRLTGSAKRSVEVRERAHGDGVEIGLESPEAFEEVVWRNFWPKRYEAGRIRPWTDRRDEEFEAFFRLQMRKVIALRRTDQPSATRYLSKANGNIARLGVIARMLPDAVLIVPYRDPRAQAASLLAQHRQFLEMHAADPFTREYMAGIGHFDFGANLKPIDFGGWLGEGGQDFTTLEPWIDYWCAAYGALAAETDAPIHFLSYERLRRSPEAELAALEAVLGLKTPGALVGMAHRVRRDLSPIEPLGPGLEKAAAVLAQIEARQAASGVARPVPETLKA